MDIKYYIKEKQRIESLIAIVDPKSLEEEILFHQLTCIENTINSIIKYAKTNNK